MFIRFLIRLWVASSIHSSSFACEETEIEQYAYKTACEQATFTFQVEDSIAPPFFIHFTNHYLPLSGVSLHTQNLIQLANTIVIEPRPLEDEPLDHLEEAYEVFQKYCLDAEFHMEFQNYMKTMCFPYYEKLKESYEEAKNEMKSPFSIMANKHSIDFESISPLFISYMKDKVNTARELEKGMDHEIDNYALEHKKTRIGLESILEKFILFTPKHIPLPEKISIEERGLINQRLYTQLYYTNHPQEAEEIQKVEKLEIDIWLATYKNGEFFQTAFNSDQENSQTDPCFVRERNILWRPRIEEIIASPDCYPPPVMICPGAGHHAILRWLEKKGNSLKILSQSGEWYPFPYTKLYQRFWEQNLGGLSPEAIETLSLWLKKNI